MIILLLFLHLVALPLSIIAALMEGLYALAIADGVVFLLLFGVWAALMKK